MESIFMNLINMALDFINRTFGLGLTVIQFFSILVIVLAVLLIITAIRLDKKTHQLRKLRKQIINHQIQVLTVNSGNSGKTKQVIRTTDQLRNPKTNKQQSHTSKTKFTGVVRVS